MPPSSARWTTSRTNPSRTGRSCTAITAANTLLERALKVVQLRDLYARQVVPETALVAMACARIGARANRHEFSAACSARKPLHNEPVETQARIIDSQFDGDPTTTATDR